MYSCSNLFVIPVEVFRQFRQCSCNPCMVFLKSWDSSCSFCVCTCVVVYVIVRSLHACSSACVCVCGCVCGCVRVPCGCVLSSSCLCVCVFYLCRGRISSSFLQKYLTPPKIGETYSFSARFASFLIMLNR